MPDKRHELRRIISYTLIAGAILYFGSCAKMGSLAGGIKDEIPPEVLGSKPDNYSINFDRDKIEIEFDEFIVLKDINQELVVSPPLEERVSVRIKNKSIIIDLENELRDSTTYTLNFGEAIVDNNEGNPLSNYEYVFSTGDYLDSLSVGGKLSMAFDLSLAEPPVHIMLYDKFEDSVVFNEIPVYIGKPDKNGNFRINNLKADTFKIFALKDANNNFLFDQPNEEIAFLEDSLIVDPQFFLDVIKASLDTIKIDSIQIDTLLSETKDTTILEDITTPKLNKLPQIPPDLMVEMFLFMEENQQQFLKENNRKSRNKLDFNFALALSDSFYVKSLRPQREDWYLVEESLHRDSMVYWVVDKEVREMDSIQLELNYMVLDSLNERVWKRDSLYFLYRETKKTSRKNDEEIKETEKLVLSGLSKNKILELNQKLKLFSETPINYIDTSLIEFFKIKDTLEFSEAFSLEKDSVKFRKMHFIKEWEHDTRYHLVFYPGAVMDVFGSTNDTLDLPFKIREEEYYGVLIVEPDSLDYPAIIQLMDNKNTVLREKFLESKESMRFEFLPPGKYKLKFIEDRNGNRKWDTGKYIEKKQPERVYFYYGDIQVRSNWDLEIKLNKTDLPPPPETQKKEESEPTRDKNKKDTSPSMDFNNSAPSSSPKPTIKKGSGSKIER